MCDINQRWRAEQAFISASGSRSLTACIWLEDVTTCDDYQGLARITAKLTTPIAGGEYVYGIAPSGRCWRRARSTTS